MTRKIMMGLVISVLSVATGAQADIHTHGAAFVAYNAGQSQNVDYVIGGARTSMPVSQQLIASVARTFITGGAQTFTLRGNHVGGPQTSSCTLYSTRADSTIVASKDLSAINVAGIWTRSAQMTSVQLLGDTRVAVLCSVAGSFQGVLQGISASP